MTAISIKDNKQSTQNISLADLVPGRWYRISEFSFNQNLVGLIGLCVSIWCSNEQAYKHIFIEPDGSASDHPALKFELIGKITIAVE